MPNQRYETCGSSVKPSVLSAMRTIALSTIRGGFWRCSVLGRCIILNRGASPEANAPVATPLKHFHSGCSEPARIRQEIPSRGRRGSPEKNFAKQSVQNRITLRDKVVSNRIIPTIFVSRFLPLETARARNKIRKGAPRAAEACDMNRGIAVVAGAVGFEPTPSALTVQRPTDWTTPQCRWTMAQFYSFAGCFAADSLGPAGQPC